MFKNNLTGVTLLISEFSCLNRVSIILQPIRGNMLSSCPIRSLLFSRAWQGLHVFPRLALDACLPALATGSTFSYVWRQLMFVWFAFLLLRIQIGFVKSDISSLCNSLRSDNFSFSVRTWRLRSRNYVLRRTVPLES